MDSLIKDEKLKMNWTAARHTGYQTSPYKQAKLPVAKVNASSLDWWFTTSASQYKVQQTMDK